jgi:hypothetical protein
MTVINAAPGRVVRYQVSAAVLAAAIDVHHRHGAEDCPLCGEPDCQMRRLAAGVLRRQYRGYLPDELRGQAAAARVVHRPPFGRAGRGLAWLLGLTCRECGEVWPCRPYRHAEQVLAALDADTLRFVWCELLAGEPLGPDGDPFLTRAGAR